MKIIDNTTEWLFSNLDLVEECKEEIVKRLGKKYNLTFDVDEVNPTAGAHCGPDTLGVTFIAKHR